ncbi:nucleoside triphosphate pyrophosphohydrolase [Clostridium malenominatum]|uniref:Nucleoside triphosphate pyrophosphohydrolase n=1 Tax=Clostridium malenominatum TaxID=1539 RepID=A0ABN1IRB0_9CLOT
MKIYNKLVRDKIPEVIEKSGKKCEAEVVSKEEHYIRLKEKLKEEVDEFLEAENIEELADIYEVIAALASFVGKGEVELMEVREKKREERGGFSEGVVLRAIE